MLASPSQPPTHAPLSSPNPLRPQPPLARTWKITVTMATRAVQFLVPVHPTPLLPPAQPSSALAAAQAAGLCRARSALLSPLTPGHSEILRGLGLSGHHWLFSANTGPAAPCQQSLCPPAPLPAGTHPDQLCSLIRKPGWARTGIWRVLSTSALLPPLPRPLQASAQQILSRSRQLGRLGLGGRMSLH